MNALGHDFKNMAFKLIESEPILFVTDKFKLNCVGFARDYIVLQIHGQIQIQTWLKCNNGTCNNAFTFNSKTTEPIQILFVL